MNDDTKRVLQRDDIVGKSIRGVYHSDWEVDSDGYGGCEGFVELEDGVVFKLQEPTPSMVTPILAVDPSEAALHPVPAHVLEACKGKVIREVIAGEYWPWIGLLLDDETVVFKGEFSLRRVGPCVEHRSSYRVMEFSPYWPCD